jgi:hypothetical protein
MEKYLDPKNPGSFGGIERFYESAREDFPDKDAAKRLLQQLDPYTINKETRRKFKRNRIIVINPRQQLQMDLADFRKYRNENNGVQYLLFAIDCFTKKASVQPLLTKGGTHVKEAIKTVFADLGVPQRVQVDKGSEFYNSVVKTYLKKNNITLFSSENDDVKCSMAERLIRTFKARIWRMFRYRMSTTYIDKLQDFVFSYNRSVHSSHGLKPINVNDENSLSVFNTLYGDLLVEKKKFPKFRVGDHVRISKNKGKFEKGYEYRFQERIYRINKVIRHNIPVYELKTIKGSPVAGKFYEHELSLVRGDLNDKTYWIEKIIKERTRKGKRECLVRWLGYDSEDDEWIPKTKCTKIHHST